MNKYIYTAANKRFKVYALNKQQADLKAVRYGEQHYFTDQINYVNVAPLSKEEHYIFNSLDEPLNVGDAFYAVRDRWEVVGIKNNKIGIKNNDKHFLTIVLNNGEFTIYPDNRSHITESEFNMCKRIVSKVRGEF